MDFYKIYQEAIRTKEVMAKRKEFLEAELSQVEKEREVVSDIIDIIESKYRHVVDQIKNTSSKVKRNWNRKAREILIEYGPLCMKDLMSIVIDREGIPDGWIKTDVDKRITNGLQYDMKNGSIGKDEFRRYYVINKSVMDENK